MSVVKLEIDVHLSEQHNEQDVKKMIELMLHQALVGIVSIKPVKDNIQHIVNVFNNTVDINVSLSQGEYLNKNERMHD